MSDLTYPNISHSTKQLKNIRQCSLHNIALMSIKRLFTILLSIHFIFLMCFMLLSSDTSYISLTSEFVNGLTQENGIAVLPEGDYKLTENIVTNVSFSVTGKVKIDLNGKSISFISAILPSFDIVGGELIITDSDTGGTIASNRESVLVSSGTLTLEKGTIIANSMASCIFIADGAVMNMNGGTVMSNVDPAIINYGVFNLTDGIVLSDSNEEEAVDNHGTINDSSPDRGEINIELEATYPTVNYSLTLPVIDSLSLQRTEDTNISEKDFEIVINDVENLFDERYISVSFVTDGIMSDGEGNTLPFDFEIEGQTPDETGEISIVIDKSGTVESFDGRLLIDTKNIPARGVYTADIVYTVEVNEVSDE